MPSVDGKKKWLSKHRIDYMYIAQGIHWLQNNLSNVTQDMNPDKYLSPRFSDGDISNASVRPSVRPSRYLINTGRNLTKLRTWPPHVVRVCESNISTESGNFATACHRLRGLVFFFFFFFFFFFCFFFFVFFLFFKQPLLWKSLWYVEKRSLEINVLKSRHKNYLHGEIKQILNIF